MTDSVVTSTEAPADAGLRGQGLAVVAVLAAIIAVVVLTFSFSTHNTRMSIDGDRATYSSQIDE